MKIKTAKELMKEFGSTDDWKSLKLWSWVYQYGDVAEEWNNIFPPVVDDRRVFINTFYQVYNAIDSLPENPNAWVCCAISHEVEAETKRKER